MSRVAISLMLFAALVVPAAAQNFGAETFVLNTEMQVVVIPNYRVPAVTQWFGTRLAPPMTRAASLASPIF